MAASATESGTQVEKVTLRVIMDKEKKKLVYAEAGKDFVDILLSFLTLPLGTIARLVAIEDSNIEAVQFGSISSLYQCVADLDQQYLLNQTCKQMLLKPRNSMEGYCQHLKFNIDNTPVQYFMCDYCMKGSYSHGGYLSTFKDQKCRCGYRLYKYFNPSDINSDHGFVKETASFIIHDDLSLVPFDLVEGLRLLQMNGINDTADVERNTMLISKKEVVDLLKLSLLSKTPLTDFILKKKPIVCNSNPTLQSEISFEESLQSKESKQVAVKLLITKSNRKILFATGEEDFADFLFSFLTFPLGGVMHMLQGLSSLSCIDTLYKSMTELSPHKCLRSEELKNKLSNPQIFPKFEVYHQILPIGPASLTSKYNIAFNFVDPKSPVSGGFARVPLSIMVTDDLIVTPISSFDWVSYLERMKVPFSDVEEMVINIGFKEGLKILKASLTTTSVLTNVFKSYIDSSLNNLKKPNEENEALADLFGVLNVAEFK